MSPPDQYTQTPLNAGEVGASMGPAPLACRPNPDPACSPPPPPAAGEVGALEAQVHAMHSELGAARKEMGLMEVHLRDAQKSAAGAAEERGAALKAVQVCRGGAEERGGRGRGPRGLRDQLGPSWAPA